MKPIVIAGNGPSLAHIDYSRLPKDFDVFRCNQFYFEDRYFLGKRIKGVFYNPYVLKEQFFTLHHLKERGEYEVEDVYCSVAMGIWDRKWKNGELEDEVKYNFPSVKNTYPYLAQMKDFDVLLKFHALYYNKRFTSGIMMLIVALAQGYREIYLTGIDFYQEGGVSYVFEVGGKKQISEIIPDFNKEDFKNSVHCKNVDVEAIELALKLDGVQIFNLSPFSPLDEILPLAPIQNDVPMEVLPKKDGYICDFVPLPFSPPPPISNSSSDFLSSDVFKPKMLKNRIGQKMFQKNLEGRIKNNVFYIILKDFFSCFKILWILLKK